jgi:predicted DNA-binding antitoxin AbrB/MazE fold protein
MTITVDATYEDGVLKPAQPLPLPAHAQVRVTVEPRLATTPSVRESPTDPGAPSLVERIIARGKALPEEVLARLPRDGASQHDHYTYGTPKRTDVPE